MANLGLGKTDKVTPLSEQAAIDLGAEIINDLVIVVCALSIYLFVESIPSKSHQAEEERRRAESEVLRRVVYQQSQEIEDLTHRLEKLERRCQPTNMFSQIAEEVSKELTTDNKFKELTPDKVQKELNAIEVKSKS